MIYAILLIYIAVIFWGSLSLKKTETATPESYFLADRNVSTLSLFFTILATNFSAFYFLGFAGEGYRIGYAHYIIMGLGTAFAALSILLIGTRAWTMGKESGYITPADLVFGQTGDRTLATLFSGVMIVFTLPYMALQIVGGGYILETLTSGTISYQLAILLLTLFTIVYVIIGGMSSVTRTDLKQGLMVILFMSLAVLIVGHDLGGVEAANEMAQQVLPELFSPHGVADHYTPGKWFSFIIFWIFCIPMFPQLFMRFYIARDLATLKKSAILYGLIPLVISLLPVMIGVWGHISFPELGADDIDQIMPMMLLEHTTEWFAALVMTGAIAAFMSTLDSQLLALSTMVTRDFIIPFHNKSVTFKEEVFMGRILVAILAIIGWVIALNPFDTIFDMGKMSFTGTAILFPIGLAVTRFKLEKPVYGTAAIIAGLLVMIGFHYGIIPIRFALGFETFIPVIVLSCLVCAFGTKRST